MPVLVSPPIAGQCIRASGVWSARELLSCIASVVKLQSTPVDMYCIWFDTAPVPRFTSGEHARLRCLLPQMCSRGTSCTSVGFDVERVFQGCGEESVRGDATMFFCAVVLECMRPSSVSLGSFPVPARVLRSLVMASPSSYFKLHGHFPGDLLVHLDAPTKLNTSLIDTYYACPKARAELLRLCTTSVRVLEVDELEFKKGGLVWDTIICILKKKACSLLEVRFNNNSFARVGKGAFTQLLNTPRFVNVRRDGFSSTRVMEESTWKAWKEKKKAVHVFFSAASINNTQATPHAFTWVCGKDVRRIIMNYVMRFA